MPTAPCFDVAVDVLVTDDGRLLWLYPTGRTLPVVRGGDGDPDPEPDPDPDPTDPDPEPEPDPTDPDPEPEPDPDPDGDLAKAKAKAAKANREAASLRKRLKALEAAEAQRADADKSDLQRAQDAAAAADKRAADAQHRIVAAEIKAALAGIVPDPAAVVEDLNLARFVDDDGEPDQDAIDALKDRYAGLAPAEGGPRKPKPNPAQGANGKQPKKGLIRREDLKTMTPAEINKARENGELDHLMGRKATK
ncbi:MAG TPA: hypothetical protein VHB02_06065 [Acidimicrobiales bacterium]|nr:hypothetical protein [Acidimicrobiales bacterium]